MSFPITIIPVYFALLRERKCESERIVCGLVKYKSIWESCESNDGTISELSACIYLQVHSQS